MAIPTLQELAQQIADSAIGRLPLKPGTARTLVRTVFVGRYRSTLDVTRGS